MSAPQLGGDKYILSFELSGCKVRGQGDADSFLIPVGFGGVDVAITSANAEWIELMATELFNEIGPSININECYNSL